MGFQNAILEDVAQSIDEEYMFPGLEIRRPDNMKNMDYNPCHILLTFPEYNLRSKDLSNSESENLCTQVFKGTVLLEPAQMVGPIVYSGCTIQGTSSNFISRDLITMSPHPQGFHTFALSYTFFLQKRMTRPPGSTYLDENRMCPPKFLHEQEFLMRCSMNQSERPNFRWNRL